MANTDSFRGAVAATEMHAPEDSITDKAQLARGRKASTTARNRYSVVLRLIRRIHLYTGLFMTPWVFLYGVSGFLFNHPGAFSGGDVRSLRPD